MYAVIRTRTHLFFIVVLSMVVLIPCPRPCWVPGGVSDDDGGEVFFLLMLLLLIAVLPSLMTCLGRHSGNLVL